MKIGLYAFILAMIATPQAAADVMLSPLRHVLNEDQREVSFAISNPSGRILDGRVTWVDLSATPDGYVEATPDDRPALSAAPYLTVSPSYFRLEPGGRATINVRLKDGVTPPQGERRSHLLFETAASRSLLRKTSNSGLQVDIGLGVSAPVILRNGANASAKLTDTKLLRDDEGLLLLSTAITPQGDISTYGRITVSFTPKGQPGAARALGMRENVAGFLDADHRTVEIPLGFVSLGAGELKIRYQGAAEFENVLFDERKFDIAPPR